MASIIYNDKELMRALLEAGVHFGHQTKRWNPKMKPYIFMKRNGIYIVDLRQTMSRLKEAYQAVKDITADGGTILFVGTKKQAQISVAQEAQRANSPYVSKRWLGGTLTNHKTLKKSIDKMRKMEKTIEGNHDNMIKKEIVTMEKKIARMNAFYNGVRDMKKIPSAMFVVDMKREMNAVLEAKKLGITLIGIADTNCDPDFLDYIIPGNDDAIRAVGLICALMADAVIEGSSEAAKKGLEARAREEQNEKVDAVEVAMEASVEDVVPKDEAIEKEVAVESE